MVCAPWAHRCVHDGTVGCLEYHAYHIRVVGTGVCESGAQLVSETRVGADIIVSPLCIHHGCARVYIITHLVLYSAGQMMRIMQRGGDGFAARWWTHDHRVVNTSHASREKKLPR